MNPERLGNDRHDLTSTRRLTKNVLLNLVAQGGPLLASLFCIPILVHRLGTEQFGILTLAWAIIGYFGIFDFGLGRALSKIVAERLGLRDFNSIPAFFWTGIVMMWVFGLVAAGILGGGASYAVKHILHISIAFQHETLIVLYLLAATIPFVITTSGMMGVIAAYQRFDLVAKINIPLGTWMFLGPVIAVLIFHTLISVIAMMVIGRCVMAIMAWWMCNKSVGNLGRPIVRRDVLRPLLGFGSWVTVSNLVSPIMEYMDRFFIAAVLGLSAVAYYATPFTVAMKFQMFPIILLTVLFPALSTMLVYDRAKVGRVFEITTFILFFVMLPITIVIVAFGNYGLTIWLGKDFANHSAVVLQILMIGIFTNSLAFLPYALIQADGRPDITAILHLIELPAYLVILWYALHAWGIVGAAVAWSLRVTIDCILLFLIAAFKVKCRIPNRLIIVGTVLICSCLILEKINNMVARGIVCALILGLIALWGWRILLEFQERSDINKLTNKYF